MRMPLNYLKRNSIDLNFFCKQSVFDVKYNGEERENMIKVAAYCRVSTDKDDQINSFESQKCYFEKYINLCVCHSLKLW